MGFRLTFGCNAENPLPLKVKDNKAPTSRSEGSIQITIPNLHNAQVRANNEKFPLRDGSVQNGI